MFGRCILRPGGSLDRAALAQIVFEDSDRLAELNGIMHPRIRQRSEELIAAAPPDAVVVYDMPLLVEQGLTGGWDYLVVVEADEDERVKRVHHSRGLGEDEIRARMAAQASDRERRAVADVVIENNSGLSGLAHQVGRLWERMVAAH